MTKSVTLHLSPFGYEVLDDLADRTSHTASHVARTATLYYLADRDSERLAWRMGRFRREDDRPAEEIAIDFDDETWRALSEEAARQAVAPERLANHALLYYLADLDSGRVSARLEGMLDGPTNPG